MRRRWPDVCISFSLRGNHCLRPLQRRCEKDQQPISPFFWWMKDSLTCYLSIDAFNVKGALKCKNKKTHGQETPTKSVDSP